jgi:hypothetical protein
MKIKKQKVKTIESVAEKIDKMGDHLLGIWRFRETKKKYKWCITFVHDSYYYDLQGTNDVSATLDMAYKKLLRLENKPTKSKRKE